jgi:hypothetical protein
LVPEGAPPADFKLIDSVTATTGTLIATYQPTDRYTDHLQAQRRRTGA